MLFNIYKVYNNNNDIKIMYKYESQMLPDFEKLN